MYAIVTLRNSDGSYDQVGMSNRWPISDLKTFRGIRNRVRSSVRFNVVGTRIEYFHDLHTQKPFATQYLGLNVNGVLTLNVER